MTLLSRVARAALGAASVFGSNGSTFRAMQGTIAAGGSTAPDYRERYAVLRAYYANNGLYQMLNRGLYEAGIWSPAIQGLRNPAYRIVEAHAAHLWPGDLPDALPIQTDNARIIAPIQQLWAWSNWAAKKQQFARWLPMLGDVFVKVATRQDGAGIPRRVYFELIDPAHVWDFDTDERGFLTWIRIDIPQQQRDGDRLTGYTHVEVWDKTAASYRRWAVPETRRADLTSLDRLGPPAETRTLESMGIPGFVPIVHAKFLDVGEPRGVGAYLLQLDKIDVINQDATRLAQMLFRHGKNTLVVHGAGKDATGRPLPAPRLDGRTDNGAQPGRATVSDDDILYIPGDARVDSLVPNLPYDAHRNQILDALADLERDRPELAVARVQELSASDLSGRALRFALGPFVKLEEEVRGTAEDALARLDMIGLTLGVNTGLFADLGGDFASGAFEHQFAKRPIIPDSEYEQAQTDQLQADALQKLMASGAFSTAGALRQVYDFDEAQIQQMATERQADQAAALEPESEPEPEPDAEVG